MPHLPRPDVTGRQWNYWMINLRAGTIPYHTFATRLRPLLIIMRGVSGAGQECTCRICPARVGLGRNPPPGCKRRIGDLRFAIFPAAAAAAAAHLWVM